MVTYVIASKATQPFLPECQMLGEFLSQNCPDVSVQVVIKSNEDWGEYIDAVSILSRGTVCLPSCRSRDSY